MARLLYSAICSLDGYVADASGDFSWAAPDAEVHAFANELERGVGTCLYGRRMYEVMRFWEAPLPDDEPAEMHEFAAAWREADKVVFSVTLPDVSTARTRLVRAFDAEQVRAMRDAAARDLSIGGPTLAAAALRAGLVDDVHLILVPEVVGGGTAALPDGLRMGLSLVDMRRFANGTVALHYRPRGGPGPV